MPQAVGIQRFAALRIRCMAVSEFHEILTGKRKAFLFRVPDGHFNTVTVDHVPVLSTANNMKAGDRCIFVIKSFHDFWNTFSGNIPDQNAVYQTFHSILPLEGGWM